MPYRYNPFTGELDLAEDVAGGGGVTQIDGDSGSVTPVGGTVNIIGDAAQGSSTSGAGDTLTITLSDATESQKGVVELATDAESIAGSATTNLAIIPSSLKAKLGAQTQYTVALGNTQTGAVNWSNAATDGQLMIGATGADPAFADLTSTGGTITITPGTNTLNLESGASVPTTFTTDSGDATPAANVLIVAGGDLISTSGASNTITIDADDNVVGAVNTDSGLVTPTSNTFMIAGGTNVSTSGSSATITIDALTGGQIVNVTALTEADTDYTVLSTDYYLSCNVNGGVLTIDLPDAGTTGRVVIIKDSGGDAATNNITVTTTTGTDTIDGATTFVMNTNYEAANFLDNGTSWEVF